MASQAANGGGRPHSEQLRKQELLKEIRQLNTKIQNMEREKSTHIYNRRSDFRQEFAQLEELDQKLNAEKKSEFMKMSQQLTKIRNMVKRFRRELLDVKPTPEFVEKLKVMMEDIEGNINALKMQQRKEYEEMMREEKTVTLEITALEKKFDSWAQMTTTEPSKTTTTKPLASARDVNKDLPPEVAKFDKFLQQTGGVRGGWDEYDHGTFLRFRNRQKGRSGFLDELIPALPTKTEQEIRQHEDWYQEYLTLNDCKKQAIQKWRVQKQSEKEELVTNTADVDSEEEEEEKRKTQLQQQIEAEKFERRKQLDAWKVQREIEKAEEEERRLHEELIKMKKDEKEKLHQMEVKRLVDEHKQYKKDLEDFEKREEMRRQMEEEERRKRAAKEVVKFRERDLQAARDKVAKEKSKQDTEREQQHKLELLKAQVKVSVKRDPSRLYQLTEGWKAREKEMAEPSRGKDSRVYHMPHRAVPSWRQGLH